MTASDNDLQAQAADWLVRLDAGTADRTAFEAWRDADPRHAVAFAQATQAWDQIALAGSNRVAAPGRRESLNRRSLLRAASVALPVVGGGLALFAFLRDDRAYAATAVGERRRFEPVPGVTVELNTDSRVAWRQRGELVDVWLERGEAAVLVGRAIDGLRLHIGEEAVLLGPGFYNARADDVRRQLIVLEGGARVQSASSVSRDVVGEGQGVTLNTPVTRIVPVEVASATAWRRGEIVFSGEPLQTAVAEYNRYLDRKLIIADPEVAGIRIGGRFETLRPEPFLAALAGSFDLKATPRGDVIVIERNSPPA